MCWVVVEEICIEMIEFMSDFWGIDRKEGFWGNGGKKFRIFFVMVYMIDLMRFKRY